MCALIIISASDSHFPLSFKRHLNPDRCALCSYYRRSRFGDLNTVRVFVGPDGMTAGGGSCSDGPSLACLRVEARFFYFCPLNDFTIAALVKILL